MLLPSTQIAISVSRSSPKRASRRSGRDRHSANTSLPARGLRGVSATSFLLRCHVEPVRDEGLLGSRVASPFGFTPKKVLGIEGCGNLRLRQLQNRLQTLWSSYQTIDFESLKTELTDRPPDVASRCTIDKYGSVWTVRAKAPEPIRHSHPRVKISFTLACNSRVKRRL